MIINTGGRTDTVQYYSEWLLCRFSEGYVLSRNPLFPNRVSRYELTPDKVDCVVFCSKNYKPILPRLHEITERFHTYFHYTITAYGKEIEPGVPSIEESMETLAEFSGLVGKQRVAWRYDPVLLTEEDRDVLARGLGSIAARHGIRIQTCGTDRDYSRYGVHASGCMTLDILGKANGLTFKNRKHKGMRQGCHCVESRDIGAYDTCLNGCKYCYASFMKRFTGHEEPWGSFLDVKVWPEIKNPGRYAGKELFIGSVTDPYLPQEKIFERTRALLTQLQGSGAKLSIATKSDLVLRDLELIKTFPDARVSWSVNTLDEAFRADMDRAAPISRRLAAMEAFYRAGVRTTCFISPIFPGITDVKAIIRRVKGQCNLIWLENLNLRGSYKPVILNYFYHERIKKSAGG